jgi:hypothetical protein
VDNPSRRIVAGPPPARQEPSAGCTAGVLGVTKYPNHARHQLNMSENIPLSAVTSRLRIARSTSFAIGLKRPLLCNGRSLGPNPTTLAQRIRHVPATTDPSH